MDFVERLFGVSPDGGNGAYEVLLVGCAVVLVASLVWLPKLLAARAKAGRNRAEA